MSHASCLCGAVAWDLDESLEFMSHCHCSRCRKTHGSPVPRIDRSRELAIVPMGTLDDDPGLRPRAHIFLASKAPWYDITDDLPQHAGYPT